MPYKDREVRNAKAREYCQKWRALHGEEWNAKRRARWAEDPEYREANKVTKTAEANAAHQRVHKAVKRGEIVRPSTCSECGKTGLIEAAHENYTERLAIRWLCRSCHRKWDAANPKHGSP